MNSKVRKNITNFEEQIKKYKVVITEKREIQYSLVIILVIISIFNTPDSKTPKKQKRILNLKKTPEMGYRKSSILILNTLKTFFLKIKINGVDFENICIEIEKIVNAIKNAINFRHNKIQDSIRVCGLLSAKIILLEIEIHEINPTTTSTSTSTKNNIFKN